jgi:hypothetical protein
MGVAWAVLVPIALFMPAFLKRWRHWFLVHKTVMTVAVLCTIVGGMLAFSNAVPNFPTSHSYFGIVVVCAAVLQLVLGLWKTTLNKELDTLTGIKLSSSARKRLRDMHKHVRAAHQWLGRVLAIVALVTVHLGIHRYAELRNFDYANWFFAVLAFWVCLYIALRVLKWWRRSHRRHNKYSARDDVRVEAWGGNHDALDALFGDAPAAGGASASAASAASAAATAPAPRRAREKPPRVKKNLPAFSPHDVQALAKKGRMVVMCKGGVFDVKSFLLKHPYVRLSCVFALCVFSLFALCVCCLSLLLSPSLVCLIYSLLCVDLHSVC